jgi:hypothetical protein
MAKGKEAPAQRAWTRQAPAPEVLDFMAHYGITERLGRPRERLLTWLARLAPGLAGLAEPASATEAVLRQDLRSRLFYLEGILRLYRRRYEGALEGTYRATKALEDSLGAAGAALHLVELALRLGVPEPVLRWCETQASLAKSEVAEQLSRGWLPLPDGQIPMFRGLCATLAGLDFEDYARDRRSLRREIRSWLGKLADRPLDMYVLQGNHGLHELRRQLRWLPIIAVSLDGLIVTSDESNPIKEYRALLTSKVAESPYARLPPPTREHEPIAISRSLFLATTDLIAQLGELKDRGEELAGLEHALIGGGVAQTSRAASARALELLGRSPEQLRADQEQAERLYRGLRRNRFFKILRSEFKS